MTDFKIHTIDLNFKNTPSSIAAYLVECGSELALVETGPHSTFPTLKNGIEKLGFSVDQIKHVFLSHIHLDHAGSAWEFARGNNKIYVHPRGKKHLLDPSRLLASAKRIYQDEMDRLWGTMEPIPETSLIIPEDKAEFKVGDCIFRAHYTPGHANHHIAWQLEDIVFAGDVGGVQIEGFPVIPPCPPPDINIELWLESIQILESLQPTALFLTHFGEKQNPNEVLTQLKQKLKDWSNWIKPYFDNKTNPDEVVPLFENYVKEDLIKNGIDGENLLVYEKANPAWMSVYGLMRYWEKKMSN